MIEKSQYTQYYKFSASYSSGQVLSLILLSMFLSIAVLHIIINIDVPGTPEIIRVCLLNMENYMIV